MTDIDTIVERERARDVERAYHGSYHVCDADYPEFNNDWVLDFDLFHDAAGDYCLCIPGTPEQDRERSRKLYESIFTTFRDLYDRITATSHVHTELDAMNLMRIGRLVVENLEANGAYWDKDTQTLRMRKQP